MNLQGRNVVNSFVFLAASLPGMWERTVTVGSAGKTFSATGWKVKHKRTRSRSCLFIRFMFCCFQVGWAMSSGQIIKHMKTVHQNSVYHCATAAQVRSNTTPSPFSKQFLVSVQDLMTICGLRVKNVCSECCTLELKYIWF